jgi:L-ascorbate metabolism protein UlaG (beta-lactamase superfamily)
MKKGFIASLIISVAFTLSGGCALSTSDTTAVPVSPTATFTPAAPTTILQYIGHSCTLIAAPDGTRIVSDPYGDRPSGLAAFPDDLTAEAVTISHFHPDHDNSSAINGKPKVIYDPGSYQVGMVKITGYKGDHGLVEGKPRGANTIFVFEIGELTIVHLGAQGVVTEGDILAAMENADVIIVDIMGDVQHPLKEELDQLLERNVRTIIPGHYSFEGESRYYDSATLDEFLQIVPSDLPIVREGSTIRITAPMPRQIVVLAPSANET